MSQPGPLPPGPSAPPPLAVRVVFEPGHHAQAGLVAAYTQVVPIARRALRAAADRGAQAQEAPRRQITGAQ
jgi:hypothetical protein